MGRFWVDSSLVVVCLIVKCWLAQGRSISCACQVCSFRCVSINVVVVSIIYFFKVGIGLRATPRSSICSLNWRALQMPGKKWGCPPPYASNAANHLSHCSCFVDEEKRYKEWLLDISINEHDLWGHLRTQSRISRNTTYLGGFSLLEVANDWKVKRREESVVDDRVVLPPVDGA